MTYITSSEGFILLAKLINKPFSLAKNNAYNFK